MDHSRRRGHRRLRVPSAPLRSLPSVLLSLLSLLSACGDDPAPSPGYDLEALRDPETCASCHPDHYREWLGSMHAYAGEDPVFLAMNAKGQRETAGALGDFCVNCHAPAAVALGLTEDGLNLEAVPRAQRGVTCWFCHQVEAVEGTHDNPLRLAMDTIMRGDVPQPLRPDSHEVVSTAHFDRNRRASSDMCGSCHDIVTPAGAHIERTYAEWDASFYSDPDPEDPEGLALWGLGCNDCHMQRSVGAIADYPEARDDRDRHDHRFVGVDVAITDFPDAELGPILRQEQLAAIAEQRKTSLCASLCVRDDGPGQGATVTVWLHDEGAGHSWPSGATPDRRAWIELIARDDGQQPFYSSGVVADDQPIVDLVEQDPALWLLRDRLFDADGVETHDFWRAASYESDLLEASSVFGSAGDASTWRSHGYVLAALPASVDMRVRLRPIGLDVLDELVASGDLDPGLRVTTTFDVAPTVLAWSPAVAVPSSGEVDYGSCVSSSPGCSAPELQ